MSEQLKSKNTVIEEKQKLIGLWAARIFTVIGLAFFSYSTYTLFFIQQGKAAIEDTVLLPITILMFVVSAISFFLIRGHRFILGIWLLVSANLIIPSILGVLVLRNIHPVVITYLITLTTLLAFLVFPRASRWQVLTAAAVTILTIIGIEMWNPAFRGATANLSNFTVGMIVLASLGFLAFFIRQAWSGNIRVKIVTSFTVIALISVAIVGTIVYISYRNQVREDIRQRLLNIASITATQLDGDLHATLQTAEDMQTEGYWQMMAQGDEIVATDPTLTYIYTMRMNDQGQIYFIIDSRQAYDTERVDIGTVYEGPSETLLAYFKTPDHPFVEKEIFTDEYGSFLSAYAPFYRADGSLEGIFGIDIAADVVLERERAILYLILGTTLGTMTLVILLGLWLAHVFVGPIINLSTVAKRITEGDLSARATIETTDEVSELAKNFNSMTSRLQETLQGLERRVAERTRNLELAAEVGRTVSQVRALDVMLTDAAELIRTRFDLYYVQVYLVDPSQTYLNLQAGTGNVGTALLGRNHRLPFNSDSINGRAAVEKKSVVISDTTASATFKPNPLLPNTRSEMAVPLLIGERVVGVLDMQSEHAGSLSTDILAAFEALAGQLAIAIQNANFLAETEKARAQVETQARRQSRSNWNDYLDAIHKPEETGFVFEKNHIAPMSSEEQSHPQINEHTLSAPIEVIGESLGNLVVEMGGQSPISRTSELVDTVARQVAQQIESLRLLGSAERYRAEAEESSRRITREGWKSYVDNANKSMSYVYDLKEVRLQNNNGDRQVENTGYSLPLKVRDETIGKMVIQGLDSNDGEGMSLANAVAERLGTHIESLRQFAETQRGQIELDKRAQQLAAVAEISTVSSKELDIEKMLQSVVYLTQRKFGLYHAHIFTFNEGKASLEIQACGWQEGDEHEGTHGTTTIPITQEQSLVARAARTRKAVIVNNVHNEAGWLPNPLLPNTASEMAVPMIVGDQVLGVLDVQSDQLNAFTEEDANIQTTLASQVATALQNARTFSQAQQQAERESTLNAISQKIQSATTVEAVLQIAARELGHALGAPMTIAQLSMKDKK